MNYPPSSRGNVVEELHGERIADPYRWLEELDSAETRAWIDAQNRLTQDYLASIPEREAIRNRLRELWDFEKFSVPYRRGQRVFMQSNDGLQNQHVLYWADSPDGEFRVLLDPNTLSDDGTVALSGCSVSRDGRYLAYGLSSGGSDWIEWHVREVETGRDLDDVLEWSKFSGAAWRLDGSGFYYSRYDEPVDENALKAANFNQKLCFHALGTTQDADPVVYERPDNRELGFMPRVTEDGRYLVITVWKGTDRENNVCCADLDASGEIVELITGFRAGFQFVTSDGDTLYFQTDLDAPQGRLIAVDLGATDESSWREIVPESPEALQWVASAGGRLAAHYLHDASTRVRLFDLQGAHIRDVELPGPCTAGGFGGQREDRDTWYACSGFSNPSAVYHYDLESGRSDVYRQAQLAFDPDDYVTEQLFYPSRDGTRVPMFLSRRRDIPLEGGHPVYLYGYGGFDVSLTPAFSAAALVWMERGGVYAVANLRGGGEYGREWHDAGRLENKQNVFDDFIAAAEFLYERNIAGPVRIAIGGGSNGGLLVGACMTQRPDLFGACVAQVGVLDMLRFEKFTIGWAWRSDYGSVEDEDQFRTMLKYSPLHNLREGESYPPTLITTGDHDDRVYPAHSFKFAAALQHAQGGDAPALIRVETRAGHGAGKPTAKIIEESADRLAFMSRHVAGDT